MEISFDPAKRAWTLEHRGLDFADGAELLSGPHATRQDERFEYGEDRFVTAGYLRGRMVVMVWTPRGDKAHVLSMRHCHAKEEARWRRALG